MLITSTDSIQGKNIKEYRGIVFGEIVNGIDFSSDFSASITNFTGGRSEEYENELVDTRAEAIKEMIKKAEKIEANALVGVKFDYETISFKGSNMAIVVASGTAVITD